MPELHNLSQWPLDKILPYIESIKGLLLKFEAKWPDDVSLELLCEEIDSGAKQLWVVFDAGEPRAVLLGSFKVTVTGFKRYEISAYAGELRQSETGLIKHIERYARKRGAVEMEARSRLGFRRVMRRHGYKPKFEILCKPLGEANDELHINDHQ